MRIEQAAHRQGAIGAQEKLGLVWPAAYVDQVWRTDPMHFAAPEQKPCGAARGVDSLDCRAINRPALRPQNLSARQQQAWEMFPASALSPQRWRLKGRKLPTVAGRRHQQ